MHNTNFEALAHAAARSAWCCACGCDLLMIDVHLFWGNLIAADPLRRTARSTIAGKALIHGHFEEIFAFGHGTVLGHLLLQPTVYSTVTVTSVSNDQYYLLIDE